MILYIKNKEEGRILRYPENIKTINDYINRHGYFIVGGINSNIDDFFIEDLWDEFSGTVEASWLNVDGYWLDRFVDWINGRDLSIYK